MSQPPSGPGRAQMMWLAIGIVAAELLAVGGLVLVFTSPGINVVAAIVSVFLVVVPILFGVAVRSELKARRKG